MNVIRLRTYVAKVLVAVMFWIGLAGPLAIVHARSEGTPKNAVAELKDQAQHIEKHAEHGHHGGVVLSHNGAPLQDSECLKFCVELMDTLGVLALPTEHTVLEVAKDQASKLAALYPPHIFLGSATAASATGPPFARYSLVQSTTTGSSALLLRNHRLRN